MIEKKERERKAKYKRKSIEDSNFERSWKDCVCLSRKMGERERERERGKISCVFMTTTSGENSAHRLVKKMTEKIGEGRRK